MLRSTLRRAAVLYARGGNGGRSGAVSAPHDPGRLDDRPQLRGLVVRRQGVADDGGREAALRRQREPLERYEGGGLADPRREHVDGLPPTGLRRDEPEHADRLLGNVNQRLESAGSLVVVLEQEPLDGEPREDPLREP